MTRFRIICPECGAALITANRLEAVLEVCPACKQHEWDMLDALLADHISLDSGKEIGQTLQA
jgi:Zn-finger nucleic acid-binding protein